MASVFGPIHKNGILSASGLRFLAKKIKRYLFFFDFHFLFQTVCKRGRGVRVSPKRGFLKGYTLESWNRSGEECKVNGCNWKWIVSYSYISRS